MQLLNELTTPAEQVAHARDTRTCSACEQPGRRLLDRRFSTVTWDGQTHFPPREFVSAQIQAIEETWACTNENCGVVGVTLEFRHIGQPAEIVSIPMPEAPAEAAPPTEMRRPRRRPREHRAPSPPEAELPLVEATSMRWGD